MLREHLEASPRVSDVQGWPAAEGPDSDRRELAERAASPVT
ncbi:hypothetical protein [Lewinella cohaerens]|nr:hypothetical protein [Lewinella cohaerens]